MFSGNVFAVKEHQLAEKWTSPRPAREPLLFCIRRPGCRIVPEDATGD